MAARPVDRRDHTLMKENRLLGAFHDERLFLWGGSLRHLEIGIFAPRLLIAREERTRKKYAA